MYMKIKDEYGKLSNLVDGLAKAKRESKSEQIVFDCNKYVTGFEAWELSDLLDKLQDSGYIEYEKYYWNDDNASDHGPVLVDSDYIFLVRFKEGFDYLKRQIKEKVDLSRIYLSKSPIKSISWSPNVNKLQIDKNVVPFAEASKSHDLLTFMFKMAKTQKPVNLDEILSYMNDNHEEITPSTQDKNRHYNACNRINARIGKATNGLVGDFLVFTKNSCQINPKYVPHIVKGS